MLSIDTNLFVYAENSDCAEFSAARAFIQEAGKRTDVVLCDLVLVEVYLLLRNPAVITKPLTASQAVAICVRYRTNPNWRVVESAPVMHKVWEQARQQGFARRRIIDARLAFTLRHYGVIEFATANTKDFQEFGFNKVWNPLLG
jgi:toxin-antitoxin system PIN domain toxin